MRTPFGPASGAEKEKSKREIDQIQEQIDSLKNDIDTNFAILNEHTVNVILAEKKTNRQKLAIELLSEWNKNLDRSTRATHEIVDKLNEHQCEHIVSGESLTIDAKYTNKLKISLISLVSFVSSPDRDRDTLENLEKNKIITVEDKQITLNVEALDLINWHLKKYLNSLETIMIAWQRGIAEPEIIENQFEFLKLPNGRQFTLHYYRKALDNIDDDTYYPAIEAFEENLDKEKIKNKRKEFLNDIKNLIESKLDEQEMSSRKIIEEVVRKELDNYNKQPKKEKFKILRILAGESIPELLTQAIDNEKIRDEVIRLMGIALSTIAKVKI